jgi:hypothetical protein
MGLDQYFYASKTLSAFKKKEKLYIDYFNTVDEPDMDTDEGLFVSEFWGNGAVISKVLDGLPTLAGQVGTIRMVKRMGDTYQVSTEAMYWRKANQVHKWFVEHPQGGIDDCGYHPVGVNHLVDLQERVTQILDGLVMPTNNKFFNGDNNWMAPSVNESTARKLLPATSGFFFGSTDYNKWYFDDLRETKKFLRKVLKQSTSKNWSFMYHSSW